MPSISSDVSRAVVRVRVAVSPVYRQQKSLATADSSLFPDPIGNRINAIRLVNHLWKYNTA